MNDAKRNKIIVASTVGAVMLVLILAFVLTFQIVSIIIAKKQLNEYKQAEQEYLENIEQAELTLSERRGETWVVMRAKELGYKLPGSR